MSTVHHEVATILICRGIISREQLGEAQKICQECGSRLDDTLVRLGHASNDQVMAAWGEALRVAVIDLTEVTIPPAVLELMPESVARENFVLPLALEGGILRVAMSDPTDFATVEKLQFILNKQITPVLAARDQIVEAINRHYGQSETESVDSMLAEFTDTAIDFTETEAAAALDIAFDVEPALAAAPAQPRKRPLVERRATVATITA